VRALNLHLQLGDASERNRPEWGMMKLVVLLEEIGNNLAHWWRGIIHRRHAEEKNRGKPCSSRESEQPSIIHKEARGFESESGFAIQLIFRQ
jgi:hypothetical protein